LLQTVPAGSQEREFGVDRLSVFRAVSRGVAKKALLFYENRARQLDDVARSSDSPEPHWQEASRAYREASNSAHYLGDLEKAIAYGERALALAEKIADPRFQLRTIGSLVAAHQSARNFAKAAEYIELGFKIANKWPPNSLDWMYWHGAFYSQRGRNFTRHGEYEKAVEDLDQAIQLYNEFLTTVTGVGRQVEDLKENARTNMLFAYGRRGFAYQSMGSFDRALDSYQKALEAAKEWGIGFPQSAFYLGLGMGLHSRKDFTAALDNLHKALDLARRQQRPDVLSNAARRIGDVLRETGRGTEAITFYREAVEQIESVRSLLSSQSGRQTYFGGWLEAYWGMIEALWDRAAHDQAFHYSERVRSRSFLDMLGTKVRLSKVRSISVEEELGLTEPNSLGGGEDEEGRYQALVEKTRKQHPEQASLMSVEPLTLKQVQALLEPRQALLEYLVTPRKIYLWVLDKERVRAFTIPLSQKELIAKVQALRTAISDLKPLKEYQTIARELYEQLLTPATALVRGKELIIVPHDVLHYLPFQALYSTKGKYLVEDHSVSYLSSASLIQYTKAKRKTVGQRVLAVGNPNLETSKIHLPLAELEANEIRRLYPRSAVFAKAAATEEKVKSVSPAYDVLHFATHAELKEEDPLSSAVLLAKGNKEDGRLEVREIFAMDLKASLVVLSGCETGLGKLSSGDELVGLTRAFIYAGSPSVVASLWKVDDASTAYLMSSFYRNLKMMTKVEALRRAQLEMIRGGKRSDLLARRGIGGVGKLSETPTAKSQSPIPNAGSVSTSHPYFWAPFILVGDGK